MEIFGLLHIILTGMSSIYGLITTKSWLDKLYIYYICIICISWTSFNGECILSLVFKTLNNVKSDYARSDDMVLWFGDVRMYENFVLVCYISTMISIARVLYRNHIPIPLIILFTIMSIIYVKLIRYYKNKCDNVIFLSVQSIFKLLCIYLLVYVYCKLKI